ncbi:hypothetical protein GCM10023189_25140 [Nibrella saemangeumensis]|uniref:Septum formation inhibitor Maf n=1 Tax=Nibrella saemangeumensis TaxID=1084526 RepID=A0ABP8MVT3_9BACT
MFIQKNFLLIIVGLSVVFAIAMKATIYQNTVSAPVAGGQPSADFSAYWHTGKAELNRYTLQQAQYGALNPGEAVLVFVTEDFRTDTQVKAETDEAKGRATNVLKLNSIKKFVTGIYDYSVYTSVFTPIDRKQYPNTLKISTSVQEWCGHTYLQLNYRSSGFQVSGRSYFENEVAEDYRINKALLEDELWTLIRLSPDKLPVGAIKLIPGTQSARLRHKVLSVLDATATLADYNGTDFPGSGLKAYTLNYQEDGRQLTIIYEKAFPHRIVGWEETYMSRNKPLTSRAVLQKTIQTDYWNHNAPADTVLRQPLGVQ